MRLIIINQGKTELKYFEIVRNLSPFHDPNVIGHTSKEGVHAVGPLVDVPAQDTAREPPVVVTLVACLADLQFVSEFVELVG